MRRFPPSITHLAAQDEHLPLEQRRNIVQAWFAAGRPDPLTGIPQDELPEPEGE